MGIRFGCDDFENMLAKLKKKNKYTIYISLASFICVHEKSLDNFPQRKIRKSPRVWYLKHSSFASSVTIGATLKKKRPPYSRIDIYIYIYTSISTTTIPCFSILSLLIGEKRHTFALFVTLRYPTLPRSDRVVLRSEKNARNFSSFFFSPSDLNLSNRFTPSLISLSFFSSNDIVEIYIYIFLVLRPSFLLSSKWKETGTPISRGGKKRSD